jgi:hypothetical protein
MEKRCIFKREYRLLSEAIWTFWLESCSINIKTKEELTVKRARWYGYRKLQTKAFLSSINKEKHSIEFFENCDSPSSNSSPPITPTNSLQPFTLSKTKFSSQSSP